MTAPLVAVCVLLLGLGVGSAWYLHRLQRDVADLLIRDISSNRAAEEFVITFRQIEAQGDAFVLTGSSEFLDAISAHRPETERWLGEAERLASGEAERGQLAAIRAAHDRFWVRIDEFRDGGDPRALQPEMKALVGDDLARDILGPAQLYLDSKEREVEHDSEQNRAMPDRVALVLLVLGTTGAAAGLIAGFGIARGVSRSIAQLSVPIRVAAGKLSGVVGPITLSPDWDVESLDVALRKMAEEVGEVVERLERTRREALRAEQLAALGQLAAGLAHELRNPLTSMKILVQSAVERGDAAGLRGRPLAVLEEEIRRLESSIQAFLDFARPPALEKRKFDLGGLLAGVIELIAPRAALTSVGISADFPGGPIAIEADMGQIRQVLMNILLNALDAVPGGGKILVRATTVPGAEGPRLRLEVLDSGVGIAAGLEVGDKIYEPFVSTKETGLGLGLSICKRIVEAHGGHLVAANRPEGGASFTVILPLGDPSGSHGASRDRGRGGGAAIGARELRASGG